MYVITMNLDENALNISSKVALFSDLPKAMSFLKAEMKKAHIDVDALFGLDVEKENTDTHKFYMDDEVTMEYDENKELCFHYMVETSDVYATIRNVGVDTGECFDVGIYDIEE